MADSITKPFLKMSSLFLYRYCLEFRPNFYGLVKAGKGNKSSVIAVSF